MDCKNVFDEVISASMNKTFEGCYEKDGLMFCPVCNKARQTIITHPFTGKETKVGCICDCMIQKQEAEEKARKEAERKSRLERVRLKSFEQSECSGMVFAADDMKTPELSKQMRNYAKHFQTFKEKGQGLVLFGNVGTGKTFYSACIANALIDEGYSVLMTNFPNLISKIQKDTFKNTDYFSLLTEYDLLIVDDLGVERSSEYMQEQVYTIIDSRYRAKKPLIVSTNLTVAELASPNNVMADRIYSRILERCLPVKFDGKNRRKGANPYKEMQALLNG